MASISFPSSPSNGDTYSYDGLTYQYNSTKNKWSVVATTTIDGVSADAIDQNLVPSANVTHDLGTSDKAFRDLYLSGSSINLGDATISSSGSAVTLPAGSTVGGVTIGTGSGGATQYANTSLLPTSGLTAGEFAFVGNTLFMTNGTGWYSVALINQTPELTLSTSSITLGADGNTIDFTFTATDPDGPEPTVSISNSGIANTSVANINLYTANSTVTVDNFSGDAYDATITLTATDGINQTSASVTLNVSYLSELWDETVLSIGTNSTNSLNNSTFIDRSTNAHTVTPTGSPVQTAFHPYLDNWSVEFDGSSSYIHHDSGPAMDTDIFTWEAWIWWDGSAEGAVLSTDTNPSNSGPIAMTLTSAGKLDFARHYLGNTQSTALVPANKWTHIAVERSGSTVNLYIDGTQEVKSVGASEDYNIDGYYIGQYIAGDRKFPGYISNVRIVRGSLVYNTSSFTPSSEPLTAITGTELLTCQSNRFIDNSSNGYSLAAYGTPKISAFNPFGQESEYAVGENNGSTLFNKTNYLTYPQDNAWIFGTDDVTMEAWVYPIGTQGDQYTSKGLIYGKATGAGAYWFNETFTVSATDLSFSTNNFNGNSNYSTVTASNVITTNQWHHVVFTQYTIAGTRFWSLYCNGDRVYHAATTDDITVSSTGWTHHTGYYPGNAVSFDYNGYISDLKISKSSLYTSSSYTIPTSPLGNTSAYLYAPMDNAGIFDKTGNHTLTTVGNASTSTTQTKFADTAIYFDGTGDYITIPDYNHFDLVSDFTIEFWMYHTSTSDGGYTAVFGGNGSGSNGWNIYMQESSGNLYFFHTSFLISATSALTVNTWHHIGVTRSGSDIKMFVDGTQVGSTATSSATLEQNSSNLGTRIGYDHGANGYYEGYIENLQVSTGVAKYTTNFTPPTSEQGRQYQAES